MDQSREPVGERRRYERFDLGLPVSFEYEFGGKSQAERGRLINMSAGGAFLPCRNLVAPGTVFQLRIDTPFGRLNETWAEGCEESPSQLQIKTEGEVLRAERNPEVSDSGYVAVRFTSPLRILRSTKIDQQS